MMLPKDQELAHIQIKPENITKFKIGAKKDGRIVALITRSTSAAAIGRPGSRDD